MKHRLIHITFIVLAICCSCKQNSSYLSLELPISPIELYNSTKSDSAYKRKSIAFSKADAYGMNRITYNKYTSDSLRTDICYIFYYVGTEAEIKQIKADLQSTPPMHNTVVYWDKKKEFTQLNDVISPGVTFIAFITDIYNHIMKVGNPTIIDFSCSSLDKLQNDWKHEH